MNNLNILDRTTKQYQVDVSHGLEDGAWDAFLARTAGGHHVQTSLWSQLKGTMGWRVVRIVVRDDGVIVGGVQILLRPLPLGQTVGYATRAPLLAMDDERLIECVVTAMQDVMRSEKMVALLIQPPDDDTAVTHALPRYGFGPCPIEIGVDATVKIDLTADLDAIMARMKSKTRYNIRLGLRKGMSFRKAGRDDLPQFHTLLVATSQRQGFSPYPLTYFETMWDLFDPHGYIHLFFASYDGEPVSANLAIPFGDTLVYKKGAWGGQHSKLRPNEVMHWGVMHWAKKQGYRFYDLEGIEVEAARTALSGEQLPSDMLDSTSRFKLGFGGQPMLLPPPQAYVANSALRWGYNKLVPRLQNASALNDLLLRIRAR